MDREASLNVVEKQRLRDAIADQVQRFLQSGGHITVVDGPAGAPAKATYGNEWDMNGDLVDAID